jgi:hypothetical protein
MRIESGDQKSVAAATVNPADVPDAKYDNQDLSRKLQMLMMGYFRDLYPTPISRMK